MITLGILGMLISLVFILVYNDGVAWFFLTMFALLALTEVLHLINTYQLPTKRSRPKVK